MGMALTSTRLPSNPSNLPTTPFSSPNPNNPFNSKTTKSLTFPEVPILLIKKRFAFSYCLCCFGFCNCVLCAVNFSGGGSSLSHQEREEIYAEVDAEFEAEQRGLKKRKKEGKRVTRKADDDIGSLFGDGITGKLPRFANKITFKVRNCNWTPLSQIYYIIVMCFYDLWYVRNVQVI